MKNETKLKRLMLWCDENGIEYRRYPCEGKKCQVWGHSNLFLPKYCVSVKLDGPDAEKFYQKHRRRNPVFIRDEDTPKFIIEKVQNTIMKSMLNQQRQYIKQNEKAARKERKRKMH